MFNWETLVLQSIRQKYVLATDRQNIINMHINTEGILALLHYEFVISFDLVQVPLMWDFNTLILLVGSFDL